MVDKTKFFWAIIGDSAPEPVAVSGELGKGGGRMAYTIGCEDPFEIDTPDSSVQLIHYPEGLFEVEYDEPVEAMPIPETPAERQAQREKSERWLAEQYAQGIRHGYAGFGARVAQSEEPNDEPRGT